MPKKEENYFTKAEPKKDIRRSWLETLKDLNVCSQKGLGEMFDSSIGAASVYMPDTDTDNGSKASGIVW